MDSDRLSGRTTRDAERTTDYVLGNKGMDPHTTRKEISIKSITVRQRGPYCAASLGQEL